MLSEGDLVNADLTPNLLYHGHTGRVIRVMSVLDGPGRGRYDVAEVVWDDPPVRGLGRQVMSAHHLLRLGHVDDYVIQE